MKNHLKLIVLFCTVLVSCSPTKSHINKDVSENINDFEDIKNYLIDNYRVNDDNVWIDFNEYSKTLSYVGNLKSDRNINDEKLISFFDKKKIKTININWKTNKNDHYLFKDSILTLEFRSSPFIQKRKLVYFDCSKFKIVEDDKSVFKINHETYLVYLDPHAY